MNVDELLTNELHLKFDEDEDVLHIYTVDSGIESNHPIDIRLSTFLEMGEKESAKFLGERLLLLMPTTRKKLYGID